MIKTINGLKKVSLNLSIKTYLDKTYGNPYFSVTGEFKTKNKTHDIHIKTNYGNADQYKYELHKFLIDNKLLSDKVDYIEFMRSFNKDDIYKNLRIHIREVSKLKLLD